MRRKEPVTDKNWRPGALEVPEVAASLDRIYKKVNAKGFTEEAAVGYVLSGHKASLGELVTYCDEETLSSHKSARRIGFRV